MPLTSEFWGNASGYEYYIRKSIKLRKSAYMSFQAHTRYFPNVPTLSLATAKHLTSNKSNRDKRFVTAVAEQWKRML